ncbi:MAG: tripartite tricarboxylate transporter substrate binding protein [Burkholderiales bacterium]|nr:MAG: tripartite tricarboxylate transporter substrate binding protein [Burkholderiales bacterium]
MHPSRRTALAALAAAALAAAAPAAHAQAWPSKPVRIVVPYPPGGPTDIVARVVGQRLSEKLRQPFVIENRAGAGGNLGAEAAAKAPADGYTLLLGTTAHAINPSLFPALGYDIRKDFVPVALLTSIPLVLVVPAASQAATVADVVAMAKSKAGGLAYASSGNGQSTHLAAEMFASMAGAPMTHVPYKGSAPALVDLAGGQVALMFDTMLSAMPQVKAGRLRAVAVTSAMRAPSAPDVPTVAEAAGLAGYEATAWNGLFAPAGTPPEVAAMLAKSVAQVLAEPEIRQRFAADGAIVGSGTPAEFGAFVGREIDKWRRVVQRANVKVE